MYNQAICIISSCARLTVFDVIVPGPMWLTLMLADRPSSFHAFLRIACIYSVQSSKGKRILCYTSASACQFCLYPHFMGVVASVLAEAFRDVSTASQIWFILLTRYVS
ncbi:hypothetical protein P879_06457 [Paragonimus westermani]|uniref:Uncharacterized protein n=1 Tax=Paragonimus westermani TaxID=34504 RepID=A0A8T0D1P0_9TREM|nr:hypothetical protein P879_06457 [Paragonimus westermani]